MKKSLQRLAKRVIYAKVFFDSQKILNLQKEHLLINCIFYFKSKLKLEILINEKNK